MRAQPTPPSNPAPNRPARPRGGQGRRLQDRHRADREKRSQLVTSAAPGNLAGMPVLRRVRPGAGGLDEDGLAAEDANALRLASGNPCLAPQNCGDGVYYAVKCPAGELTAEQFDKILSLAAETADNFELEHSQSGRPLAVSYREGTFLARRRHPPPRWCARRPPAGGGGNACPGVVLNQPAGHPGTGRSLAEAACAETRGKPAGTMPDRVRRRLSSGRRRRTGNARAPLSALRLRRRAGVARSGGAWTKASCARSGPRFRNCSPCANATAARWWRRWSRISSPNPASAGPAQQLSMNANRSTAGVSGRRGFVGRRVVLLHQGVEVAGLFMRNWNDDGSGDCRVEDDRCDAVAVCTVGRPDPFPAISPANTTRRFRTSFRIRRQAHAQPRQQQPGDRSSISSTACARARRGTNCHRAYARVGREAQCVPPAARPRTAARTRATSCNYQAGTTGRDALRANCTSRIARDRR